MRAAWVFLILAIIIPLAYAAPPFQTSDSDSELTVIYPKRDVLKVGVPVTLHTHVFNASGIPVTNETVNCTLHIYNGSGVHILNEQMGFDGVEWELDINATVLGVVGSHAFIIFCHDGFIGGFASGAFEITTDGVVESGSDAWVFLAFLPFLFAFLLVVGARLFDPVTHWVLHVGAYLLSLVSSFAGLWYAALVVIKFAEWGEMQEAVAWWTWAVGIMVAVFVVYWMIYVFVLLVNVAAQKKEKRLEGG